MTAEQQPTQRRKNLDDILAKPGIVEPGLAESLAGLQADVVNRSALAGVKAGVEAKKERTSIKEEIKEAGVALGKYIKDPEKRKSIIAAVGAGILLYLFKSGEHLDEEVNTTGEYIDTTEQELQEAHSSGLIELLPKDKSQKAEKELGENEVAKDYRMIAIQLKASMNKRNTRELGELGISIDEGARKLTAIGMFRKGISTFEDFKKTLVKKLQKDADPNKQIDNISQILSRCALGKFQILPKHHFKRMGWSVKGEAGLKNMYAYLRSPKMQNDLNKTILSGMAVKYKGYPRAMAAAYYAGPKAGSSMLAYQQALKANDVDAKSPEWLERKQKMGGAAFGSINYYANTVAKSYGKPKVRPGNEEDLLAFQEAIAKKETGYLAKKGPKKSAIEIAS